MESTIKCLAFAQPKPKPFMECTFRVKDILRLIESNPDAKNMIVKIDKGSPKPFIGRMQNKEAEGTEEIEGCPFPPGCNDGDEG